MTPKPKLLTIQLLLWPPILLIFQVTREVAGVVYSDDGKTFKCPLDPITERYPDPTDPTCYHYFLCHLGRAFPQRCDPRRAFHPKLKNCQPRISVPENLCVQPYDCETNGYVADTEDCTKYYMCFFRQAIPYSCITDHWFDPKKKHCVKNTKKFRSCSKPQSMRQPDPKSSLFRRPRYPNKEEGTSVKEDEAENNNDDNENTKDENSNNENVENPENAENAEKVETPTPTPDIAPDPAMIEDGSAE